MNKGLIITCLSLAMLAGCASASKKEASYTDGVNNAEVPEEKDKDTGLYWGGTNQYLTDFPDTASQGIFTILVKSKDTTNVQNPSRTGYSDNLLGYSSTDDVFVYHLGAEKDKWYNNTNRTVYNDNEKPSDAEATTFVVNATVKSDEDLEELVKKWDKDTLQKKSDQLPADKTKIKTYVKSGKEHGIKYCAEYAQYTMNYTGNEPNKIQRIYIVASPKDASKSEDLVTIELLQHTYNEKYLYDINAAKHFVDLIVTDNNTLNYINNTEASPSASAEANSEEK